MEGWGRERGVCEGGRGKRCVREGGRVELEEEEGKNGGSKKME